MSEGSSDLFRKEAVDHQKTAQAGRGDVLRISPRWTRLAYWVVLLTLVLGLLFTVFATVPEYAEGPAVIWIERSFVTAKAAGVVESVEVEPRDHVEADVELVRFYDAEEAAELERIRLAFELELANSLRDPLDQTARQALTNLRSQKELAQAMRLAPLVHRADTLGAVLRTRSGTYPLFTSPGHRVDVPGCVQVIMSLTGNYRWPEPLRQARHLVRQLRVEDDEGAQACR